MNVSLTPAMEKFVNRLVKGGDYQTASEVVRDALRLLQEREQLRQARIDELRRELDPAIAAADRGEAVPFDRKLVDRIKAKGRAHLAAAAKRKKAG